MTRYPEAQFPAPRADAILHLLTLHVRACHGTGTPAAQVATATVAALIEDYQPDDIPESFVGSLEAAMGSLTIAEAYRQQIKGLPEIMVPSIKRDRERLRLADNRDVAINDARYILRHEITLEGNDL